MLFMKFGERLMQATHFFCLSGSKWETISVQDTIRVYSRQSTIIPAMIGHTCAVRHVVRLVSKKVSKFQCIPHSPLTCLTCHCFFLQVHNGRDFVPVVINEGMVLALKVIFFRHQKMGFYTATIMNRAFNGFSVNPRLVKLNLCQTQT